MRFFAGKELLASVSTDRSDDSITSSNAEPIKSYRIVFASSAHPEIQTDRADFACRALFYEGEASAAVKKQPIKPRYGGKSMREKLT